MKAGEGFFVDGLGDGGDGVFACVLVGVGVGYEDGEGEALAVGEGDEANVVGGGDRAAFDTGRAGLVGYADVGREEALDAVGTAASFQVQE